MDHQQQHRTDLLIIYRHLGRISGQTLTEQTGLPGDVLFKRFSYIRSRYSYYRSLMHEIFSNTPIERCYDLLFLLDLECNQQFYREHNVKVIKPGDPRRELVSLLTLDDLDL